MTTSERRTVKHPARFSDAILPVIDEELGDAVTVLDPFAGTGRIHELDRETIGVEIEPEWAAMHPDTQVGNALDLFGTTTVEPESVDAVATSPTYGNRLADHHNARDGSLRRSYTHDLGRRLAVDNSGDLHWGDEYRRFHRAAYTQAIAAIRPSGRFVLNVSDHIRSGAPQGVHLWHVALLAELGLRWLSHQRVETPRMRYGANADARIAEEWVVTFRREPV